MNNADAWLNAECDVSDTNVGDLISRQALRDAMYHEAFETDSKMQKWDSGCWIRYKMFENAIDAAPAVDPVKHGEWIPHPTEADWDVCKVCGIGTHIRFHGYENGAFWDSAESYSYCPHCGAQMKRSEE